MVQTNYRPSSTALLNPCADPIFKILFTNQSKEAHLAITENGQNIMLHIFLIIIRQKVLSGMRFLFGKHQSR
jgi:hypothetical protein